jgi:hypothetical protein
MGKGTMVGLLCAFGAIFGSMIMEGGNPAALIAPPALLLIIVGTTVVPRRSPDPSPVSARACEPLRARSSSSDLSPQG